MNILLTNHDLAQYGGTQTWLCDMAHTLNARGHTVDVMCFVGGVIEDKLDVRQIFISKYPEADYDLILVNHNTCMKVLKSHRAFKIYTQHGPQHKVEQYLGGADAVVAVTPEVKLALAYKGVTSTVISNGVDLNVFSDAQSDPQVDILNLCKGTRGQDMICEAADTLGLSCQSIHYETSPQDDVATPMQGARVVVGYGRCIIEALAVGCGAFVFDARGEEEPRGDGWITNENVNICSRHGFNGRTSLKFYTQKDLDWDLEQPKWPPKGWSKRHANIEDKVDQYLALVGEEVPV